MAKIETYELTALHAALKKLATKNMAASGITIDLQHLDDAAIGRLDFHGELLPKLIPVLLESIEQTLQMRRDMACSDLNAITKILGE